MSSPPLAYAQVAADASARGSWLDRLLSPGGVAAFWTAYCVLHIALRVFMSSTLSLDDGRAGETAQELALGYQVRQPPLYSWLLWSVQRLIGPGLLSHLLLRYTMIALIGIATYGATLAACKDRRWAAVASLSLIFTYSVGWTFHEWATETLLLSIACLVTLQTAIRFIERPDWSSATWLGLAIGLGLMSKFSYPLCLVGLVLAVASLPDVRRRLLDRRLLLSGAIALTMLSPYVWWLASVHGDLVGTASAHLIDTGQGHLRRVVTGLIRLVWSVPAFVMPWLAVVALLAPAAFWRGQTPHEPASVAERITWRTMVIGVVLMAIGIAAIGATNIGERYMHPVLMIAPVYVFARIARFAAIEIQGRRLAIAVLAAVVAMLPVRVLSFENEIFGRPTRQHAAPIAGLAHILSERGLTDGTFVTGSARVAGNLRQFLPNVRYIALDTFRARHPPRRASDDRSCVLVWNAVEEGAARAAASEEAARAERIDVAAPSVLGGIRRGTWFVVRLDPRAAICS